MHDAIAKWTDCRYEDRAKAMKATDRRTGQLPILRFMRDQLKIEDNSNTVDGDQLPGETP